MKIRTKHLSFGTFTNTSARERRINTTESLGKIRVNRLPSGEDYSRVLKKLELVINNANYGQKLLELKSEEPLSIFLDQDKSQLVHVKPAGYPSPMQVRILRNYGRVKVFISKKIPEPSDEVYDEFTTSDTIEISDIEPTFKISRISLFIKALSETNFSLSLHYGVPTTKLIHSEHEKIYKNLATSRHLLEDSLDKKIKAQKLKIKMSRKIFPSCSNLQSVKQACETERFKSTSRKNICDSRGRIRLEKTFKLKRKIVETNFKGTKIEDILMKNKKRNCVQKAIAKNFGIMACFLKTVSLLYEKIRVGRAERRQGDLVKKKKKLTFKNIYKSWSKFLEVRTLFERSRLDLMIFKHMVLPLTKEEARIQIFDHLHQIFILGKAVQHFRIFLSKSNS